ncbi:hydroxyphenylacetyl-CoA thioesterase PaaI [Amorphus orientalis]|uniref:Acyl-CoA thioesterase n=1 Tax=Amorphus orientalis TaxID=649198 RepID=A0AAE3VQ53_9HYPH|nr:hydroxyphenylacetyl-CoA thioesterase PaaI [Amorphus orientalis]MDQ0316096.1 acyl-CoA thioesterase [Amorphus orientalis]
MNAQDIARACADAMWAEDKASRGQGMELVSVAPGKAELTMPVQDHMVNGHAICHGGFIFALADSAFAFSCNTYNQRTVAQMCSISFVKAAKLGDLLTARAEERWREGRSGIYDITVVDQTGSTIAEFRGQSRTISGTLLDEDTRPPSP